MKKASLIGIISLVPLFGVLHLNAEESSAFYSALYTDELNPQYYSELVAYSVSPRSHRKPGALRASNKSIKPKHELGNVKKPLRSTKKVSAATVNSLRSMPRQVRKTVVMLGRGTGKIGKKIIPIKKI